MHKSPSQESRAFVDEASSLQLNPIAHGEIHKGRRVGSGSFSIVSEAYLTTEDKKPRRVVALKELRPERHGFDVQRTQLLSEASVLARLKHKNILEYIGCGVSSNAKKPTLYMLQEYLPGGSLDEYISRMRRRRISYDPRYSYSQGTALRWAMQAASAVGYLHSPKIGIVHRDIKLANLLLTERSVEQADVKLADFGLSVDTRYIKCVAKANVKIASCKYETLSKQTRKVLSPWTVPEQPSKASLFPPLMECAPWLRRQKSTKSRELPTQAVGDDQAYYNLTEETGSYMYMSPEVWLGLPYNDKADVYSLGVLIAEVLTGRPLSSCLLPEKSYEEAKNFCYCVANGLQLKCPKHFPRPLVTILDACWEPDPTKRPTACDVLEVLRQYSESLKNAHKLPLFHPLCLTSMQKVKLSFARMKYVDSN